MLLCILDASASQPSGGAASADASGYLGNEACAKCQGLCWEAYDAATGEITVLSAVVNGKRGDPKTEARRNSVPLIQPARELLDLYRLRLGNPICG
jgi:hypothetical protein